MKGGAKFYHPPNVKQANNPFLSNDKRNVYKKDKDDKPKAPEVKPDDTLPTKSPTKFCAMQVPDTTRFALTSMLVTAICCVVTLPVKSITCTGGMLTL